MSFELTEEQHLIQVNIREFAREVLAVSAAERDRTQEYPAENLKEMGELGLMGMLVPTEYGGEGLDTISYALAVTEVAYACASTAVIMSVHNSIVCGSLARFGTEIQKQKYLRKLAAADIIGSFAMTEPEAGSDPSALKCTATRETDTYFLNGTKRFITGGATSSLFIVLARRPTSRGHEGISAFLVTPDMPGFEVGHIEDKIGLRASDTCDLVFSDCRIPSENLLGLEEEGFKIAMSGLDAGRIGIAAQSLGIGMAAMDAAVKYSKERSQFDQPIASFQGLRWMIAEMAMDVECARLLVTSAAAMKDRGEKCSAQASMAKLHASEMANRVTAQAIQIHGGYGVTKDYTVERLYRDARALTIYEGTSQIQKIVIANEFLRD
ncbi:MAG: acyl-CoA dehydrogenase family protein [Chloroflexi bacterium]|nr:acyl-CoA dehydrogenase family protein [Chloroflexota bacterium]